MVCRNPTLQAHIAKISEAGRLIHEIYSAPVCVVRKETLTIVTKIRKNNNALNYM